MSLKITITLQGAGRSKPHVIHQDVWRSADAAVRHVGWHFPHTKTAYFTYHHPEDHCETGVAFAEHENGYGFNMVFIKADGSVLTSKESTYKFEFNGGVGGVKRMAQVVKLK